MLKKRLQQVVGPVVRANGALYGWFNQQSATLLKNQQYLIPKGVTANAITTARSTLVFPTLYLFSHGYTVLPAACVVLNVTFDYVDGAVARWEKAKKHEQLMLKHASGKQAAEEGDQNGLLTTAHRSRLKETWGAYYDAIADKAFAIPVWMCAFQQFDDSVVLQTALLSHALIEGYSCYVRTKAYFSEPSPLSWTNEDIGIIKGADANSSSSSSDSIRDSKPESKKTANPNQGSALKSSVVAGIVGKTKQFVAMLGTAMIMIPLTKTIGTGLLVVSVPLAVASVVQKSERAVVFAEITDADNVSSKTLEFLAQSKAQGTKLIVGIRKSDDNVVTEQYDEVVRKIKLLPLVDHILLDHTLPPHGNIEPSFLKKYGIDKIAVPSTETFEQVSSNVEPYKHGNIVPVKVKIN